MGAWGLRREAARLFVDDTLSIASSQPHALALAGPTRETVQRFSTAGLKAVENQPGL